MSRKLGSNDLIARFATDQTLAASGLKADPIGRRTIRVSRNGRLEGVWREAIGSYDWYPVGAEQAQHRVPTVEEVVRIMARTYVISG